MSLSLHSPSCLITSVFHSSVQQPYKFAVADVAMRENGISVHLQYLQIPAALVLSDFTGRRVARSPIIPFFSVVQVYFRLWLFSTFEFLFPNNAPSSHLHQHACFFPLAFYSSLCTISLSPVNFPAVAAFYLSFPTLQFPLSPLSRGSRCLSSFIIPCRGPSLPFSSLLTYSLSSFFHRLNVEFGYKHRHWIIQRFC